MPQKFNKDIQYYKFCLYGFFKNLRFFEPFLILFFIDKGLNFLQIGTLYSIREILINILEIPSGIIADSFGRKKSLIVSFIFYIISFTIFFLSIKYSVFVLAMLFYAIGDAFRTGTHKAMIFEYLKIKSWDNQRAHYYGHTRSWSQMGSAVSSLLAASIVFYTGNYKSIFIFSIIPYLMDLILISSYPAYLDGSIKKIDPTLIKNEFIETIKNFIFSFKNKNIVRTISNMSVHSGLLKVIKDYLQPVIHTFALSIPIMLILSDKQRSALLIGIFYFFIYMLTSLASRYAGKIKDKIKTTEIALNITLYIGLLMTLITGVLYNYTFYFIAIIFYIGIYLIENIRNPIGIACISELFKNDVLATALSANSQVKSIFAAIMAPILGFLADKFGIGIALSILAALLLISTPLYLMKK